MEHLADGFWNIRGHYRIGGLLDLGTQMSLVRRGDGRFLLLDSYGVTGRDRDALLAATDGGRAIAAVLNLHPFHTMHCEAIHALLPHAAMVGTARHQQKLPGLPWASGRIEDPAAQAAYHDVLEFSIPDGVVFISADERVHVGSVIARHRASGIVHVDDTLNVLAAPALLRAVLPAPRLRFHPMLPKALQRAPGAAEAYARWAGRLAEAWADSPTVCAAHSRLLMLEAGGFREQMLAALEAASDTLAKHRAEYG